MKKVLLSFIVICLFLGTALAQDNENKSSNLEDWISRVEALSQKNPKVVNALVNGIKSGSFKDTAVLNELWGLVIDEALKKDSAKGQLLDDLNLDFKTFQTADSAISSLGFSYDLNLDYAWFKEKGKNRYSQTLGVSASGNVAFDQRVNPTDFLETSADYSYTWFSGGVVKQNSDSIFQRLNDIEDKLVTMEDPQSEEALKLWKEFGEYLTLSNQYYMMLRPKFGFESNQNFSRTQFTPGVMLGLGAKAWNDKSTLAKLNILDYPFALVRWITNTDANFKVYGSTLPSVRVGFDYVIPQNDSIREGLTGNLDPFPRFQAEAGFRTVVSRLGDQGIFFNANIRYYQELGASEVIQNADLAEHFYFVAALQSSAGFYVSYANGKLPFDALNDEVYALGFNYKF